MKKVLNDRGVTIHWARQIHQFSESERTYTSTALYRFTDCSNSFKTLVTFTVFGFSILLRDTSTCSRGRRVIEPTTFQWVDDPLYLLSCNQISSILRSRPLSIRQEYFQGFLLQSRFKLAILYFLNCLYKDKISIRLQKVWESVGPQIRNVQLPVCSCITTCWRSNFNNRIKQHHVHCGGVQIFSRFLILCTLKLKVNWTETPGRKSQNRRQRSSSVM